MSLRIRTEEEFIEKFGPKWRNKIALGFPEEMDYLFGYILSKSDQAICRETYRTLSPSQILFYIDHEYAICKDMIIGNIKLNLKPRIR
jgi:hypothetical protein